MFNKWSACAAMALLLSAAALPAAEPTAEDARAALRKAVQFYHQQVASHGGYVWRYSGDLQLREAEARTDTDMIWVQPPATPSVGIAFLEAYRATDEQMYLQAAQDAAQALLQGQLHSGGWHYRIVFDPARRAEFAYRLPPGQPAPQSKEGPSQVGGWDLWRQRRFPGDMTVLDDDTTQSAIRFLAQFDRATQFQQQAVHEAVQYALSSVAKAQYPIGAWSHNYDHFPQRTPDVEHYPVIEASYPDPWSRTWTKDFTGCYMLNDRISCDAIKTMLEAYDIYRDPQWLAAAERGGQFLLLAQMPEPQPAWAQQYNRQMQPVWDRAFEPPSISGRESQDVLETLLLLYEKTGHEKYLEPVPRALEYLRDLQLPDGRLARFYELHTNRPLYFRRVANQPHQMTYEADELPSHYGFIVDSRLDALEARYQRLRQAGRGPAAPAENAAPADLAQQVAAIIGAQDDRGAWVEQGGTMDAYDRRPPSGVISTATFEAHVALLCRYLRN